MMNSLILICDPEIMGGTPVFNGTRVPVQTLVDYLEAGHSIDDFIDDFPSVGRQQVVEILEHAKELILEDAYIA